MHHKKIHAEQELQMCCMLFLPHNVRGFQLRSVLMVLHVSLCTLPSSVLACVSFFVGLSKLTSTLNTHIIDAITEIQIPTCCALGDLHCRINSAFARSVTESIPTSPQEPPAVDFGNDFGNNFSDKFGNDFGNKFGNDFCD